MSAYYEMQTIIAQQNLDIYLLKKNIEYLEQKNEQLKGYIEIFALEDSSNISIKKQNILNHILSLLCFDHKIVDCKKWVLYD